MDLEDLPKVEGLRWSGRLSRGNLYAARRYIDSGVLKREYMHRLILPDAAVIDHIDGNTLNNRRNNLRKATISQNGCNRGAQRNNTSGFKGVTWCLTRRKWKARIGLKGKYYDLGRYDTREEAFEAYKAAASRLHGQFANFGGQHHA